MRASGTSLGTHFGIEVLAARRGAPKVSAP
jgi:hypothetical protein